MPDVSRIDEIVDQSALRALNGVPGTSAVFGSGSQKVVDPNLTAAAGRTQYVRAGPPKVTAPHVHFSDFPLAARAVYRSATVCELFWDIPMRRYLSKNDQTAARRLSSQLYALYLTAFSADTQLNGTVQSALITQFRQFTEDEWYGIEMTLTATERLNLYLQP